MNDDAYLARLCLESLGFIFCERAVGFRLDPRKTAGLRYMGSTLSLARGDRSLELRTRPATVRLLLNSGEPPPGGSDVYFRDFLS